MNSITDSKELKRTIQSFLSDKVKVQTKTSLVEKGKLFYEIKVAETFSDFFEIAVNRLGIYKDDAKSNDEPQSTNPVETTIQKFDNHPNVKLKDNIRGNINLINLIK